MILRSIAATFLVVSFSAMAAEPPPGPPKPGLEQKKLAYFTGTWSGEGDAKASVFGPAGKYTWTDKCELFPGGFFVVCNSDGKGPAGDMKGLSTFGWDAGEKAYTSYGIDNTGFAALYKGHRKNDVWTFTSRWKMGEKEYRGRYTLKELGPAAYKFKWELAEGDGPFAVMMEGKETKK